MAKLGEFELLVVLAILQEAENAYANRVRVSLEEKTGRSITRGALYRTLDRLKSRGLVRWELQPSDVPERGGHPMRRLLVTRDGVAAARDSRDVLLELFDGLDPVLGEARS